MKTQIILAALAATALVSSCSNEEVLEESSQTKVVTFNINQLVTRATTDASNNTTSFTDGDEIAIYSSGLVTDLAGEKFTVSSTSLNAPTGVSPTISGTGTASLYAYFPASSLVAADASKATITIDKDQSADHAFQANDFMTSTASVSVANPNASFTFSHALTLVRLDLTELNLNISSVFMNGVQPEYTWTYANNTFALGSTAAAVNVKMGKNANVSDKTEYWAIVPPQQIAAGDLFTIMTTDNKLYKFTTAAASTFEVNKVYKYKLSFENATMTASLTTSTAWGDEVSNVADGVYVKANKRTLIDKTASNNALANMPTENWSTSKENFGTGWTGMPVGWARLGTNATVVKTDENYAKLTVTETNNKWYQQALTYQIAAFPNPGEMIGKYKLNFTVKSDAETPATLKLYVCNPTDKISNGNTFWGLHGNVNTSTYDITGLSNSDKEVSVTVNLTQYYNSVDKQIISTTAEYINKGVILVFHGVENSAGSWMIKDLEMVEE